MTEKQKIQFYSQYMTYMLMCKYKPHRVIDFTDISGKDKYITDFGYFCHEKYFSNLAQRITGSIRVYTHTYENEMTYEPCTMQEFYTNGTYEYWAQRTETLS
jgi:hypothetical protein